MLDELIVELGAAAVIRMGRQIETVAHRRRDKGRTEELRAGRVLRSMEFESSLLRVQVNLPAGVSDANVADFLRSPEALAVAFEVLTVTITESEPIAAERVRDRWDEAFEDWFPGEPSFSQNVYEVLCDYYEIVVATLRTECPNAYARLRDESQYKRIACVLEALHARSVSVTPRPSRQVIAEFANLYRRVARDAHKDITPPDFERRRDVPIEDLYVSPTILDPAAAVRTEAAAEGIPDLLAAVDRTVLLGDPGNGKSTASLVLTYRAAKIANGPVPFLVILRDFAGKGVTESVVEYLDRRLKTIYQCDPPAGAIDCLFERGGAMVIFDGLDELLDTTHRRTLTEAVENFANRYPLVKILVTSRKVGYLQAPMDRNQFRTLELSGFSRENVEEYVQKWFSQEDLTAEQVEAWTQSFMRESEAVEDLTSTPLLLALMCILYRGERSIPRNRPAVYERCATMLFDKWDSHRGIHSDLQVGQMVDPAMKHLAYWLFTRESNDGVLEAELIDETTTYLFERSFEDRLEAERAALEFVEFCRGRAWVFTDVGTTPEGERLYKFTHRTFLEYFAAYHLSRTCDTPERLAKIIAPKVANAEWDVVAQLAVQIGDKHHDQGAVRVFGSLLNEKRRRANHKRVNVLSFLVRCLTFVQVSPKVLRQLTRDVMAFALNDVQDGQRVSSRESIELAALLLYNAHFVDHRVIEDELRASLRRAVEGDDHEVKLSALSFIGLGSILFHLLRKPVSATGSEEYWREMLGALEDDYRADYLELAKSDDEMARRCLARRWMTVGEVLRLRSDGLNPLFVEPPSRVGSVRWIASAFEIIQRVVFSEAEQNVDMDDYRGRLDDVGDFVLGLVEGSGPLIDRKHVSNPMFLGRPTTDSAALADPDLSAHQRFALAVLMASTLEARENASGRESFGSWFAAGDIGAILRARIRNDPASLDGVADYWFSEPADLLIRWGRREMDFVSAR